MVITVASLGAAIESISMGWEVWVPPLIIVGIIAIWWMHITQYSSATSRENFYIIFCMVVSFYHGIHKSSFFDVIVISALLMSVVALLGRLVFLRIALTEFFLIMILQLTAVIAGKTMALTTLEISRIVLHIVAEVCVYIVLKRLMEKIVEHKKEIERLQDEKKKEDHNMEDFLVNLSHELRTPVNVINGLSSLILNREKSEDILAIRHAGQRLVHQIEDIQDYSEIQREEVVMENDRYMITSLLNDILVNHSAEDKKENQEFMIDLDPSVPAVLRGDHRKITKIIEHLLDNAFKFTKVGGARLRVTSFKKDYGINLILEITDTGVGMTQKDIEGVSRGIYQADKKRDRSTGGIGLGLSIVYGLVRSMDGFVKIESEKNVGTTVRVSLYQEVIDPIPCMSVSTDRFINIVFYIIPDGRGWHRVEEMHKELASNLAKGLRINLYYAFSKDELERVLSKGTTTHVFMSDREYTLDPELARKLAEDNITVGVIAPEGFELPEMENLLAVYKPIYGLQIVQILNGRYSSKRVCCEDGKIKPRLDGVRALVCDDEPMNLVVAKGLFREYNMEIDTAESGREAIDKFAEGDIDIIFMDHMMPEMDGVEAMKRIRNVADQKNKSVKIVALTANAVSGAREMFLREGFDGFIAKPINISEFERVMNRIMSDGQIDKKRGTR
jgi:signal transduction histidine kinase/ActR/RegA family two-component response regulator